MKKGRFPLGTDLFIFEKACNQVLLHGKRML